MGYQHRQQLCHDDDCAQPTLTNPLPYMDSGLLFIWLGGLEQTKFWHVGQLRITSNTRHYWIDKDDCTMNKPLDKIRRWRGQDVEMELLAVYAPNEEPDTWVKYRNAQSLQEYTCRLEAFTSRYTPVEE
jgi:hypothetical protein